MMECVRKTFTYIKFRFFSIGYKKRIAIQLLLLLVVAFSGIMLKPYFFANLADLDIFNQINHGNFSGKWDKWANKMERKGYRSIGDVYNGCDMESPRMKIGKVFISYNRTLGHVVATTAANFTMPVWLHKGTVRITAQFHGRTLFERDFDMCKADVDSFKCPLKKGQEMRIYEVFKLPKYIPKGYYRSTATVSNQDRVCFIAAESVLKV